MTVFVRPPSVDSLRQRLVDRQTDSAEQVEIRVAKAGEELKKAAAFDQILVNNTLEIALADAEQLVANFLNS